MGSGMKQPNRQNRQQQISQQQVNQAAQAISVEQADAMAAEFAEDFEPVGNWVFIRIVKQNMSKGGLVLPEGAKVDPEKAIVLRTGPGAHVDYVDNNNEAQRKIVPVQFKEGDVVYPIFVGMHPPIKIDIGDHTYVVVSEEAIVGRSKKNG